MQSKQCMDRLVCGDVGFGKTEVAMRAAFTAAMNNKQVAILVPTTLLAAQHLQNFKDRFAIEDFNPKGIKFDKVVSIGMCEHVGHRNYRIFMQTAQKVISIYFSFR